MRGTFLPPPHVFPPTFLEDRKGLASEKEAFPGRGALLHFVFNIATFLAVYSYRFMAEPLYLWLLSSPQVIGSVVVSNPRVS